MKLEFNKDTLMNALAIVSRAIPTRTTNPILECILFDASRDQIKLTANDTELGIETTVEGTIVEPGMVALNARLIIEIIRKLEGGEMPVMIQSGENFLTTISCDRAQFNISGRDGEEFSYLPDIEKNNYICLSQFSLKEAVRTTIFAAALNDTNKMMGGEYIEVNGNSVKFVALDGHRIAIRTIEMKETYGNAKVIVPGKAMSEISKIMADDNEKEVLIYFSENHILFEFDDTLGGEYIEVNGNSVKFVALDGHRIAIRTIEMKETYGNAKVIVPGKAMSEISKIMADDNEKEVLIYFSENHILFEFDDTLVISRLIEGEYFRIEHMLSKDYEIKLRVNRIKFLNSIDRATVLIKESDHKPIIFEIENQGIRLKVKSSTGDMGENLSCEKSGNDLTIAFNPKFFLDALKAIEDETVDLYMTNAKAPCYIRDEQERYIYLILPVNFVV